MSDTLWTAYNAGQTKQPTANKAEETGDEEILANMTMRTPTDASAITTATSFSGRSPTDTMKDVAGKSMQNKLKY